MTGGLLTALGFMHPVGPIASMGPMIVAWGRAHWGKPIWVTSGGAELPLTNLAVATALMLMGPGRFSVDRIFGIRVPVAMSILAAGCVAAGAVTALTQPQPQEQPQPTPVGTSGQAEAREPQAAGGTL